MLVLIDPGHGIDTKGKRSPAGMCAEPGEVALFEYMFNRDIALRLMHLLYYAKIPFVNIVQEIEDVSLSRRAIRANAEFEKDPEAFLISIHSNAGGGRGLEFFTFFGQSESDVIAEHFYKEAKKIFPGARLRTDTSDGDSDKEANFAILRETKCPAVLTENFFYDNPLDLSFLLTDRAKEKIAKLHFNAITSYIKSRK